MKIIYFFVIALSEALDLPRDQVAARLRQDDLRPRLSGSIDDGEAERYLLEVRSDKLRVKQWAAHCRLNVRTEQFMNKYFSMVEKRGRRRPSLDPSATIV
jgi:hypothetical protein